MDPRLPSGWRRGFNGDLGPRRLNRASFLRPGHWAGLGRALQHHRPWGASDPPPGSLSPSWGPQGIEPSRGAPSSSSSKMMWGAVRPPPLALKNPQEPPTPLGPSTPPGSRSPRRQGGSRRPPPPQACRANARCLLKSRESRAEGAPPSRPRGDSWWRSHGAALSSRSSPSSTPRSGPDSWPGAPCPLGPGAGSL